MQRKRHLVCGFVFFFALFSIPGITQAKINCVKSRSAILIDMDSGHVLFQQDADTLIAPASLTKILTLYLVFEAIKEGQVHLSDKVEISQRAASAHPVRMGLRAHTRVSLEELIKGMAVVSGNDACVAVAEHISGSVERFVSKMNAKARELGMRHSRFMTPNGLPAPGQLTTARDMAILSMAYLHRFPESLSIHSMTSYTYGKRTHHNANRLLGHCAGVDGLKTGFVCASGYNISATAKRGCNRILAVVLGARTPWVRLAETRKLIEAGFMQCGQPGADVKFASAPATDRDAGVSKVRTKRSRSRAAYAKTVRKSRTAASGRVRGAKAGKTGSRLVHKPVKRKKVAKRSVVHRGKKTLKVSTRVRSHHAVAKAHKLGKSTRVARHIAHKSQKNARAGKSIRSSKKNQTKTVSKKTATKSSAQAHASNEKPRG